MIIPFWIKFIILSLATFRMSELISYDSGPFHISENLRGYLFEKKSGKGENSFQEFLFELATCPYCNQIWLNAIFFWTLFSNTWVDYIIMIFALSGAGSFLLSKSRR